MRLFDFIKEVIHKAKWAYWGHLVARRTEAARRAFPRFVAKAGWKLLTKGMHFDPTDVPHALVVGVALWSDPDLEGARALCERLRGSSISVFAFSFDDVVDVDEFAHFVPGAKPVIRTPVVAEFVKGVLVAVCEGRDALRRMHSFQV